MKNPKRYRLVDIGERVNVSTMVVSQVLNPRPSTVRVSAETAKRIRRVAKALGYRPNLAARQLAGHRSNLIGAVVDSCAPEVRMRMLATMERIAMGHGLRFLVGYAHDSFERIRGYAEDFEGRAVDGVVCLAHDYPEFRDKIPPLFRVFPNRVFIDPPSEGSQTSYVSPDYEAATYIATQHLLSLGRRRIAFAMSNSSYRGPAENRLGYERGLREASLPVESSLIWTGGGMNIDSVEKAGACIDELLPHRLDALVTLSDQTAMWMIRALAVRGYRVPDDWAVVSCTRTEMGQAFMPSITSLDLLPEEVARQAIEMLIDDIHRPAGQERPVRQVRIQPKLFVGESCGANAGEFGNKIRRAILMRNE